MPFIYSVKDTYRQAVESATGGKNTVMYDDKGVPSIMVRIPKFNLSDVIAGAPATPHPAFIVNGVVKSEIWISKFQNVLHDGRAYSLPAQDAATGISWDNSKLACESKGAGWHLMTNAEWAAIALWSKKNGTMPRGNNNYGKDHSAAFETASEATNSSGQTNRILTGTGPASWSHDHTNEGIFDLNGNVNEWVDGFRVEEGQIYVHNNNNFNTPKDDLAQWLATGVFYDVQAGKLVMNSSRVTKMDEISNEYKASPLETLTGATGYTPTELMKHLALAPIDSDHGGDYIYAQNYGSRFGSRGGSWTSGAYAGVFCLYAIYSRTNASSTLGFRSAFVS